jgi:hypothetical protein
MCNRKTVLSGDILVCYVFSMLVWLFSILVCYVFNIPWTFHEPFGLLLGPPEDP